MAKHTFQDQVVLITGASSGIGEATAKAFAREGAVTVLAARREDQLRRKSIRVKYYNLYRLMYRVNNKNITIRLTGYAK